MGMVHRMIAPIATVKDVYNLKTIKNPTMKNRMKEKTNRYIYYVWISIIINEMIDLFGVKTNDFRPSCNSYLSV